MESKHHELLQVHKAKFNQAVDVERLYPILQGAEVLDVDDVAEISQQPSMAEKVDKLLEILPNKGNMAFQSLCLALESTYPHLLTVMFLGSNQKVTDSRSTSLTSDSEDDVLRHSPQPGDRQQAATTSSPKTYTRIIPSYVYDIHPREASNEHIVKDEPKLSPHSADLQKPRTNKKVSGNMNEERQRDYDWLKSQCEKAMNELQSLKLQHGDSIRRCDQTMKEADYYRGNYKTLLAKLEQAAEEKQSLKSRCNDILLEKTKQTQEITELQKLREEDKNEMVELKKQLREVINESGKSDVLMLYDTAQDKYEVMRKDYDNLRKRYADQMSEYSATVSKLEMTTEENMCLKKQFEETVSERHTAVMERNELKQQCTAAIRNWDLAIHDRNNLRENMERVTLEKENIAKNIHQIMHEQLRKKQEFERCCDERNAALTEYKLVMSERDYVHKEIEQLQDKLQEAVKEIESLRTEKKTALDEGESLRREITAALQDRDKALKERNDLRDKFGDVCSEKDEVLKERDNFRNSYFMVSQERDVARQERQEALVHRDQILRETYEKTAREKAEEMEQVAKETDNLKKQIEKLQQDRDDSIQEAEIAMKRRDWAFDERNKVVHERESIRTLCDNLRRDRDRAVSDLAQALRDSDHLKKQKNEMYKDLKDTRERFEAAVEKDVRKSQLNSVNHNHSRDSAIDADLHEWETETLELDLGDILGDDLGFNLVGGKEDPQFSNDNSLFVSHVTKGCPVDGKLKINDLLVRVNNVDVTNVDKRTAFQAVRNNSGVVNLVVRRKKSSGRSIQPVQLTITLGKDAGLNLESGVFINRISPNSILAKERALNIGDRILNVNGQPVSRMTATEVLKVIDEAGEHVLLDIWKPTSPVSSAGPSPTPGNQSVTRELPTTPPMRNAHVHMWESRGRCSSAESKSTGNLKSLRCSGSQTDSLDSPGSSPRKRHGDHKDHSDSKGRHSTHHDGPFGKAYDKFFRKFRPKNHHHDHRDREERERMNKSNSRMSSAEDVIAEFDSVLRHYDPHIPVKSHDPKCEINNGGTWPKMHHMLIDFGGQGTAVETHHSWRKRPQLPLAFTRPFQLNPKIPPVPPDRTNSSVDATIRHSPSNSNSESSIKYSAAPPPPCSNQIRPLPLISSHIKLPLAPTSSSGHGPPISDSMSRSSHYSTFSTPVPIKPLDMSIMSNQQKTIMPYGYNFDRRMKPGRPSSAPSQAERRHPMPYQGPCPPEDMAVGGKQGAMDFYGVAVRPRRDPPYYQPRPAISPTDFVPRVPERSLPYVPPQGMGKTTSPIHFTHSGSAPSKHPPHQVPIYPGNSHPLAGGPPLPVGSQSVGSMGSQPLARMSISPVHSSPLSFIPTPHYPSETDPFYLPPYDKVTISPSPSQPSSSGLDRSSDDFPFLYPRSSPHGRPWSAYNDGRSTIPRRIRIPSNMIVNPRSATGSVEFGRSSPISPFFCIDMPERSSTSSLTISPPTPVHRQPIVKPKKPLPGEQRTINIEKTPEYPVGFSIETGPSGGIYIATVQENSLAAQAGLQVGDQLLEVSGINMRTATKDLATSVLSQCNDTYTMVLQFNPDKYNGESSGSSTQSSPMLSRTSSPNCRRDPFNHLHVVTPGVSSLSSPSHSPRVNGVSPAECASEPRFVFLERSTPSMELGITISGGNAVGIFVHEVEVGSVANVQECLQRGDNILEFNGVDLRSATLEKASSELSKGNSKVTILAQYNINRYNKICTEPGDYFFIRTHFDRPAENEGDLNFKKDDILLVENTLFHGKTGVWYAWLIDDQGKKIKGGTVPSKFRLEDDLVLKRSLSESLSLYDDEFKPSSRRGSGSVRRSIFRRKRHQRNNSKDSREFNSFSEASLNSDSVPILDDGSLYTYTKVTKLEYTLVRPVILLAPFAEPLIRKLTAESPDLYISCSPVDMHSSQQAMDNGVTTGLFIDYWKHDDHYLCITASNVKEICDKNCHCLLNVTPTAVERLRQFHIYPIVLFCRHKSAKQLREIRDVQFLPDRVSNRSSKDLFDQYQKLEQEHRHLLTAIIQGGNLAEMCMQIKRVIASEQQKSIWVTSGSL